MAIVEKLIQVETDGTISFGNYQLPKKEKAMDFEVAGNLYDLRTFNEITKLNKDGALLYESIPGTSVHGLKMTDRLVQFKVAGTAETQITMELSPNTAYNLFIEGVKLGKIQSNLAGKITFSIDYCSKDPKLVEIKKV